MIFTLSIPTQRIRMYAINMDPHLPSTRTPVLDPHESTINMDPMGHEIPPILLVNLVNLVDLPVFAAEISEIAPKNHRRTAPLWVPGRARSERIGVGLVLWPAIRPSDLTAMICCCCKMDCPLVFPTENDGNSPFLMGKSTRNGHCLCYYVSLPEVVYSWEWWTSDL